VLLLPQDSNRDKIQTNEQSSGLLKLFKRVSQHLSYGLNPKIALISKARVKNGNEYEVQRLRADAGRNNSTCECYSRTIEVRLDH